MQHYLWKQCSFLKGKTTFLKSKNTLWIHAFCAKKILKYLLYKFKYLDIFVKSCYTGNLHTTEKGKISYFWYLTIYHTRTSENIDIFIPFCMLHLNLVTKHSFHFRRGKLKIFLLYILKFNYIQKMKSA